MKLLNIIFFSFLLSASAFSVECNSKFNTLSASQKLVALKECSERHFTMVSQALKFVSNKEFIDSQLDALAREQHESWSSYGIEDEDVEVTGSKAFGNLSGIFYYNGVVVAFLVSVSVDAISQSGYGMIDQYFYLDRATGAILGEYEGATFTLND